MKLSRLIVIIACTVAFTGCASTSMTLSQSQIIEKPPASKAQVVFLRSSFVGSAIAASLFDVTNTEPEFIGIINNGKKIAYNVDPGKHVFMVVSEAADFMEADLTGGKTYYSIITPRMGAWKARFSLWPIRTDGSGDYNTNSKDFEQWLRNCKLVTNSEASLAWYRNNLTSVKAKQAENWQVWKTKTPADLAKRTLNPGDGS